MKCYNCGSENLKWFGRWHGKVIRLYCKECKRYQNKEKKGWRTNHIETVGEMIRRRIIKVKH